jgi:hypothetical protein
MTDSAPVVPTMVSKEKKMSKRKAKVFGVDYSYGGFSVEEYESIFKFKRDGTVPTFEEVEESKRKGKKSTFKHK